MAALDFPSSPTVGQQYAAPNGVTYQWDGAVWVVTGGPPGQLWTGGTGTLTPTDTTKTVVIPGPTAGAEVLRFGNRTIKGRLIAQSNADVTYLAANASLNAAIAWVQDDNTKASWLVSCVPANDNFTVQRIPPGAPGSSANLLTLDNAGNLSSPGTVVCNTAQSTTGAATKLMAGTPSMGMWAVNDRTAPPAPTLASWDIGMDAAATGNAQITHRAAGSGAGAADAWFQFLPAGNFLITGGIATKSTGTTWANPSDERIKKNIAPYTQGLAAILALAPKTFEFNGLGGSQDGLGGIGLIAQDVQPVMPEMVSVTPTKLLPDDAAPVDLLMLDTTALAMALINAVQELTAEVAALKAAATEPLPTTNA